MLRENEGYHVIFHAEKHGKRLEYLESSKTVFFWTPVPGQAGRRASGRAGGRASERAGSGGRAGGWSCQVRWAGGRDMGRAGQGRDGQVMCSREDLRTSSFWNAHFFLLRIAQSWPPSRIGKAAKNCASRNASPLVYLSTRMPQPGFARATSINTTIQLSVSDFPIK